MMIQDSTILAASNQIKEDVVWWNGFWDIHILPITTVDKRGWIAG